MAKPNYDFLEEERKKIWQRLISAEKDLQQLQKTINDDLTKTPSNYSEEAKQASRIASGYRNRSEESKNTILQYLSEAQNAVATIKQLQDELSSLKELSLERSNIVENKYNDVIIISSEIDKKKAGINEDIEQLEEIFDDFDTLNSKISKLEDVLSQSQVTSTKIETLHKALLNRKNEVDELYYDIFGYKDTEDGVETEVEGLKHKLDEAYDDLYNKIATSTKEIDIIKTKVDNDYEILRKSTADDYQKHIDEWELRYLSLEGRIEALLPNALTAGLSSAYSEKKKIEIEEYQKLNQAFIKAIAGLVAVSIIPLIISYISMLQNKPFEKVLLDMPRLVLSILPLYIPVLWVAYSSSRKMNLSKRLSEEYSHKEVLSKTFEGLSTQISNISNPKTSEDLRNKLLYNLLEASSENPGKLISDYNKADHPLMDALEKSVQLASAVEKLEKIPGFSRLAQKMNNKSQSVLQEESQKVNRGMDVIENDSKED